MGRAGLYRGLVGGTHERPAAQMPFSRNHPQLSDNKASGTTLGSNEPQHEDNGPYMSHSQGRSAVNRV